MCKKVFFLFFLLFSIYHCDNFQFEEYKPLRVNGITASEGQPVFGSSIELTVELENFDEEFIRIYWTATGGTLVNDDSLTVVWQTPQSLTPVLITVLIFQGNSDKCFNANITLTPRAPIEGEYWYSEQVKPNLDFSKVIGDENENIETLILETADKGFITAGNVVPKGEEENFALDLNTDIRILKNGPKGTIEWQKIYGKENRECITSIVETSGGDFVFTGYTSSMGAGGYDIWVVKINSLGDILWQKTFGGVDTDYGTGIIENKDKNYVITGGTAISEALGNYDLFFLELSPDGSLLDMYLYGPAGFDDGRCIKQTPDGGYFVGGATTSVGAGGSDFWVLKLTEGGLVEWQKTYGGTGEDELTSIDVTSDGGFVLCGYTESSGNGAGDFWIIKIFNNGEISWQNTYGGPGNDTANSIREVDGGKLVAAGETGSFGQGESDAWLFELNGNGTISWQKTFGFQGIDTAYSMDICRDGCIAFGGYTKSFGLTKDFWFLKVDQQGFSPNFTAFHTFVRAETTNITGDDTAVARRTGLFTDVNNHTDVIPVDTQCDVLELKK